MAWDVHSIVFVAVIIIPLAIPSHLVPLTFASASHYTPLDVSVLLQDDMYLTAEFDCNDKCPHVLRLLLDLFASNASSRLSPTLCKKSIFSKYPPPRRLASSSSLTSLDVTCARQSIADLSKVVIFLAF